MYEDELTFTADEPTFDELAAIEAAEVVSAYSPTFWDVDQAELARGYGPDDPYGHPSWDVAAALAEDGWDDPAVAIEIREQTSIDDARLTPLTLTTYGPSLLVLVPDVDNFRFADEYAGVAA